MELFSEIFYFNNRIGRRGYRHCRVVVRLIERSGLPQVGVFLAPVPFCPAALGLLDIFLDLRFFARSNFFELGAGFIHRCGWVGYSGVKRHRGWPCCAGSRTMLSAVLMSFVLRLFHFLWRPRSYWAHRSHPLIRMPSEF